jgi:hypothetical protein
LIKFRCADEPCALAPRFWFFAHPLNVLSRMS